MPVIQSSQLGILHELLDNFEVARYPQKCAHQFPCFFAKRRRKGTRTAFGGWHIMWVLNCGYYFSTMGQISTTWCAGACSAHIRANCSASSRSATSISAYPPITSV